VTEKVLTVRLSEQEHRALKLHAVLQGRSVNAVVTDLIRAELAKQTAVEGGRSAEDVATELLARFGIDPDSTEHRAAAERARADMRGRQSGRRNQGAA
jgi:plasmid stability protein